MGFHIGALPVPFNVSRFLGLLLVSLAATSNAAAACSCQRNPTAQSILASAPAVFTGVVETSSRSTLGQSMTTFRVTESFKGAPLGATVQVIHFNGPSASCGVAFTPGKTYTLAAHRTDTPDRLSTSLCSTWMFLPQVHLSKGLIEEMRMVTGRRP